MQTKKIENGYIVRLERGEKLVESLRSFCRQEKITSGWLSALGGAETVTIAYFDLDGKQYKEKEFSEPLEVTNLTGNIARLEGEIVFHIHGTFGRTDYSTLSGHVMDLSVGGTLELFIRPFTDQLTRKKDEAAGLNLLDLK